METKHLDLHVPKGWAFCTTRELEMIAEEMIRAQMVASLSRFHPFDWVEIKTRLFFRFAQIEIVGVDSEAAVLPMSRGSQRGSEQADIEADQTTPNPSYSGGETNTFKCRHGDVEFTLETWQVHSFIEQLDWIDAVDAKGNPKPMPPILFPYPERMPHHPFRPMPLWTAICHPFSGSWREAWPWPKEYYRPGELMDGVTWDDYRVAGEWMDVYTMKTNQLIALREKGGEMTRERLREMRGLMRDEQEARREVLTRIFGCPRYRLPLAHIGDVEWQVLMFWWSSVMEFLRSQYPKCFKRPSKRSRSRQPLPIVNYACSTGTLENYLKQREGDIKKKSVHLILYHLNRMAEEAEEMEKIRRKHK